MIISAVQLYSIVIGDTICSFKKQITSYLHNLFAFSYSPSI